MRVASEVHLYKPEEVDAALRGAVQMVENADVPDDLREAAFGRVFDTLTRKQVVMEQVSPAGVVLGPNGMG